MTVPPCFLDDENMEYYGYDDSEDKACCIPGTDSEKQCECECHKPVIIPREICESCHGKSGPEICIRRIDRPAYRNFSTIVPVGADRAMVVSNIDRLETERDRIFKEARRLQEILEALRCHHETISEEIMHQKNLISPIRKLPDEILRKIFLEVHMEAGGVLSNKLDLDSESMNRWGFPLVASQVSSHWRSVVQSYSSLWSTFRYEPPFYMSDWKKGEKKGKFVQHCISLSREMPLDITLGNGFKTRYIDEDVVKALAQSLHRWKKATIRDTCILKHIRAYTTYDFSQLETLEVPATKSVPWERFTAPRLQHITLCGGEFSQYLKIGLESAPSLEKITIKDFQGDWEFEDSGAAWTQASQLEFRHNLFVDQEDLNDIIEAMPVLKSLSFIGENEFGFDHERITIPTVESLMVNSNLDVLIDKLVAPNLQTLAIGGVEPDHIDRFIRQSDCHSLETFVIHGLSDYGLEEPRDVPNVKTIKSVYWNAGFGINSIRKLARRRPKKGKPGRDHFPQLEKLYIRPMSYTSFGCRKQKLGETLVSALRSRFPMHGAGYVDGDERYLKSLCIYVGTLPIEAVGFLERFANSSEGKTSGVDIEIYYGR